jgi:hypothetical protein
MRTLKNTTFIKNFDMRKSLLLILLMCLAGFTGWGQRFNGGILAGGDASQVDGDNNDGFHKFGYLGGALVSLRVSPHSSFQMELEYIQKGSHLVDTVTLQNDLMRFHYLEVPLLYQYTFAKRLSFEAGPAMDVLLGSLEETQGIAATGTVPMRPVTLSGIFGFSGFITKHLKGNLRFNYSLLSIRVPAIPYPPSYRKILFERGQYNNVISFSLFWYFKPNEDL